MKLLLITVYDHGNCQEKIAMINYIFLWSNQFLSSYKNRKKLNRSFLRIINVIWVQEHSTSNELKKVFFNFTERGISYVVRFPWRCFSSMAFLKSGVRKRTFSSNLECARTIHFRDGNNLVVNHRLLKFCLVINWKKLLLFKIRA